MACRAAAKATPEQKQKCRESLLWWLHGSKLRTDVVNQQEGMAVDETADFDGEKKDGAISLL